MTKVRRVSKLQPMTGQDQLKAWMERTGRTTADTAASLGVNLSTVYRWLDGSRQPSLNQATHMQSITGIPATAWAEPTKETT